MYNNMSFRCNNIAKSLFLIFSSHFSLNMSQGSKVIKSLDDFRTTNLLTSDPRSNPKFSFYLAGLALILCQSNAVLLLFLVGLIISVPSAYMIFVFHQLLIVLSVIANLSSLYFPYTTMF